MDDDIELATSIKMTNPDTPPATEADDTSTLKQRRPASPSDADMVDEYDELLPALSEADVKRLRIKTILGDGERQDDGSLLSTSDRLYILFWLIAWLLIVFFLYWEQKRGFKYDNPQRMFVFIGIVAILAIVGLLIFLFPIKARSAIHQCLFSEEWTEEDDDGVKEYYEAVKIWLLFPIAVLGLWAPKSFPLWCRIIHLTICFTGLGVLVSFEIYRVLSDSSGNVAQNVTWLLWEASEVILFLVGVVVYRNEKFVTKLFLFDNTKVFDAETSTKSKHHVSKKRIERAMRKQMSPKMGPQSSPENSPGPDIDMLSISSLSSQVTVRQQEVMTQQVREGQISLEIIQSAWRWVMKFITPIVAFSVAAWVGALSFDTIGWFVYGTPHNTWMPFAYAISPLSGTNYFVGNLFLSGASFIISTHVWFSCYSVTMELNRIVIQLSEGYLSVSDLLDSLRKVRERMEYLFQKAQYIIVYQVWFSLIMLGFIAIEFFGILPNSPSLIALDVWTMLSAFAFAVQALFSVAYAAQIFLQHRLLVRVVRVQQEIQMKSKDRRQRDLTGLVLNLEMSPIGLRICGVYLNQAFLQRMAILIGTQVFAVVYRQVAVWLRL